MTNVLEKTNRQFWDKTYAKDVPSYHLSHRYFGKNGLFHRKFFPFIQGRSNVLELGCGSSKYLMFFKMVMGLKTYGIDFSAKGCENLKIMAAKNGISHNVILGDIFQEGMDGRKFDLVFHAGLIEHFADPSPLVERCRFFCKDRGLMICILPNFLNRAWSYHGKICPSNAAVHIRYSKVDMEDAIEEKFQIIDGGVWGYPEIYAGGTPETMSASFLKYLNLLIIAVISAIRPGYSGCSNESWAGRLYFVCKPR